MEYLSDNPPTHVLVAAFLGVKPKKRSEPVKRATEDDIKNIVAMLGGAR